MGNRSHFPLLTGKESLTDLREQCSPVIPASGTRSRISCSRLQRKKRSKKSRKSLVCRSRKASGNWSLCRTGKLGFRLVVYELTLLGFDGREDFLCAGNCGITGLSLEVKEEVECWPFDLPPDKIEVDDQGRTGARYEFGTGAGAKPKVKHLVSCGRRCLRRHGLQLCPM